MKRSVWLWSVVVCAACAQRSDDGQSNGAGGATATAAGGAAGHGGGVTLVTGGSVSQPVTGGVSSGGSSSAGGSANGGSLGTGGSSAAGGTVAGTGANCELGYSEISNGRGGVNVEQVCYSADLGFDKVASLQAFKTTLYPLLRTNCSGCHSTENTRGSGAQAPIHADVDPALAHEYALTRINFRSPADSKLVVRMAVDRHNCFGKNCKDAAAQMLTAVTAWANAVASSVPQPPYLVPKGTQVAEAQVLQWIASDKTKTASADQPYIKYTSLHELQNAGVTADQLNWARAAISKALNSDARWAPTIVNPVDISDGKGMVYRFDTRDYWGYNKGVKKLLFGGSDDDIAFALDGKKDYLGNQISQNEMGRALGYTATVTQDPSFAILVWGRIVAGNVEGALGNATLNPNTTGFHSDYVEAAQLVYTLTRPDVYNSIMALPWYVNQLEDELGVDRSNGALSYQYVLTYQAITVDSRMYYRAKLKDGGYFWKTYDVFTGQLPSSAGTTIESAYQSGAIRFPFWANPIPKFIPNPTGGGTAQSYSFIATLNQYQGSNPPAACDAQPNFSNISGFYNCRYYTGDGGLQESAEEIIFSLPNGLQAYMFGGGFNQRRVDAFTNIVRDPRLALSNTDDQVVNNLDFGGVPDHRLNVGASCISCHTDGMNRGSNNLRDWLDESNEKAVDYSQLPMAALKNPNGLPAGQHGVDSWINDSNVKAQIKQYYPPSSVIHAQMEADRRPYLSAIGQIKKAMVAGADKNLYVEPVVWTFEWAQKHYAYPQERSN